jgi:hypothetical protein
MVTNLLYGLYAGGVSIVITLIAYYTGIWKTDTVYWIGYLQYPFLFLFIWLAMKERKNEDYGGVMSYGQGVGTGTMVGLFSGLLLALFMWVYLTAINPDFQPWMVAQRAKDMQASNAPAAQREAAISMMEKFFVIFAVGGAIIGQVFIAVVGSLIISVFVRTKPEEQQAAMPV